MIYGDTNMAYNGGSSRNARRVALNAATGGAGPLSIAAMQLSSAINVVDVTIDTNGMRDPVVLLNFTSIVSIPAGASVTLNFVVTRSQNGGPPVNVGSTFTFFTQVGTPEAVAFGFQFFDNNLTPGVYTYSVQLSRNSVINNIQGLTINNATLSALAVDNNPL